MSSLIPPVSKARRDWYSAEKNTAALIQSVVKYRSVETLSGNQIWSLIQLTWITMGARGISSDHWKRLKIPALATLFERKVSVNSTLAKTVDSMHLPTTVARAAREQTGMVNFRGTWRNASRKWCSQHRNALRRIIRAAAKFPGNDRYRYDLAIDIAALPSVKSPNNKASAGADVLLTPLIACLDPKNRFPVLNGRKSVRSILRKLKLRHRDFRDRVEGVIGIIGRNDAFMFDVMSDAVLRRVSHLEIHPPKARKPVVHVSNLRDYDQEERSAVLASRTVTYKKLHNRMTASLNRIFKEFRPIVEKSPAGRSDTVVEGYDGKGRDLLVEAKPIADRGSIRIAVGQLFDYARYRERHAATDLLLLTIPRPAANYVELLNDLGITAVWFGKENCKHIAGGKGKAWPTISNWLSTRLPKGKTPKNS